MARLLVSLLLAALFAYMALRELRSDSIWALIYLLISLEYGLDMIGGVAKPKKAAK